ncbi:MAG: TonB-dependent receptor [Flavobacteriaceae bacterium]|nr:TonB-dependent receptor [Flavobacteriaceae bacterium]
MQKLFLGLLLACTSLTMAQRPQNLPQVKISGTVIDKDSGQPLEYATLVLQSVRNPEVVTGGITDAQGRFEVETTAGRYHVSIEYISYTTYRLENQLLRSDTDLGVISLAIDVAQLDEVEVIAERTTVELRLDKKIYNVGKDLTVRGGTVSDVLDNVPSVSVDVEGNVQLRGNDDARILINGKPSAITGLNSTDALRQLPAESIEKVEVITSPSARYDAEGSGGIINIILRRSKLQGLNGALTANGGYPWSAGINGNLNYRTGDLNFFTNTGYNYRERPGNSLNDTDFFDSDGQFTNSIREERDFERVRKGLNANFGLEWYVGKNTSITNSIFVRDRNNTSETSNNFSQRNAGGTQTSGFRFDPETENDDSFQYALNFDTQFNGNSDHTLTFAFQYETSDEIEESLIVQNGFDSERVRTAEDQERVFFQLDYVVPSGKGGQFEFGYRGDFNQLSTDYDVDFISPTLTELGITDPSNVLEFEQRVNAFYSQYGNTFDKFSFLAGLRYEATKQIVEQLETNEFSDNDFNGLFPTLNLNYELSEGESFQFGYNRRIRRPRSFFLNPFPSRSSPTNLFQGNPNLAPSFSNQVDFGYLKRFKKLTLNGSIYYQRATDVITFITEDTGETTLFDGETVSIIRRTPVNLASNERFGFEVTSNYRPTRKWNLNGNVNIFNLITRGDFNDQNFDAENLSWFIRLNNKITLPKQIDWQTRVFYRGPTENAQTKNQGIFSMDLAFSKDFFNEKASLAFNVSDVFNSRRRVSETITPFFETDSEFQWRVRSYNLSFTYRFNQKKKRGQRQQDFDGDGEEFGA